MAAEPQQKNRPPRKKRTAPASRRYRAMHRSGSRLARSHGFDAGGRNPAERARHLLFLKQHQAFLIYTCALDIPRGIRGKTISVGVPFQYEPPDEQANAARQEPIRSLPFTKAVQDVVTSVDDLKCDFSLVEGRHLQADAPSMFPIAGITHWLVAQVPNKAGIHVLTFQFSVPYTQDVAITPEPKVHMGEPRLTLLTSPVMTWTGGTPRAVVNVYSSNDQPVRQAGSLCGCQIHRDDAQRRLYLVSAGAGRRALRSLLGAYSGARVVLDKDGRITVRGERGVLTDQYDVTASSTLDRDPYGVPCSPDNLKKSSGYWAESVSGDGQGETLEIRLRKPGRLLGIMLETGISR